MQVCDPRLREAGFGVLCCFSGASIAVSVLVVLLLL